ncbi:MAG: iron-siderophore ABC transporter substrate-binding protein [Nostoc sp. DedVER02]|uniref:ABC transporter substrate-binding protein n=1 Tax=unclassified Nostoc TaxID=2593658 RepID=UPI002AD1F1DD|nr:MULTISPECIES: iron-siderophore ABC transporter substrate-binding protein [unclassified Nostoc]MDZ7985865.1 iron-siderophore ABC transporter substrate-binding protein [Nostoc sp. DedVER02]MDZ8114700.1 iron-siderophore ABC transporter substrate-binding protein [Nostoc sp. DedVER01b]
MLLLLIVKGVCLLTFAKFVWVVKTVFSSLRILWQPRQISSSYKFLPFFLTIVVVLAIAAACNHNTPQLEKSQTTENCRIVQHAMGEICVPNYPKRIVTLNPAALGNAIALGIQPAGSATERSNQWPPYLKDKIEGIKFIGTWGEPNLESVALLKPDVIIGWKHNQQSTYPQLSYIAPTTLYDWVVNINRPDNWKEYFNFMAKVLDREDRGQQLWQHYNQRIEQLKSAIGDRYQNKTISVVIFRAGMIYSVGENSFIGSILSDVGLKRPESQKFPPNGSFSLSEETLEMADGDVMFITDVDDKHNLSILKNKPLWKKLKAVQQNHIFSVESTNWESSRNLLAANTIIDDLFKYLVNTH